MPGLTIVPPGLSSDRAAEARRVKRRRNKQGQVVSSQDIPSLRSGFRTPRAARDRRSR